MKRIPLFLLLALFSPDFGSALIAAELPPNPLLPLMLQPGALVLEDDFSTDQAKAEKATYSPRQVTPWQVKDGVLLGSPNPPEIQASRPHHKGKEARVSMALTPRDFIAQFALRLDGGEENSIVPFVEFGHHCCRVTLMSSGVSVVVDGESLKVASADDYKVQRGTWYHILAEMKGEEFVIQLQAEGESQPLTLYAQHASFLEAKDHHVGIAGTTGGMVLVDDVKLWEAGDFAEGWETRQAALPEFKPVPLEKAQQGKKS